MRIWRTAAFVLGMGLLGAQAPPAPTFDVAVIHPAGKPTQDAVRSGQFRAGTTITKGNAEFDYVTLGDLIPYAYHTKPFQVAGPTILKDTRWNIQATFAAESTDQVPEMMQALLEDRFKLAFHSEKRDLPVYELVVAKGGPKMEEVEAVAAPAEPVQQLPGPAGRFGGQRPQGGRGKGQDGKAQDGKGQDFKGKGKGQFGGGRGGRGPFGALGDSVSMEPSPDTCGIKLTFAKVSMANLADALAPFLDRPVLDSTGLKGSYKAAMTLPQDAMRLVIQNQAQNSGLDGLGGGGRGGFAGGGPGGRGGGGGAAGAAAGGGNGKGKGKGGPGACDAGGSQATGSDTNSSPAIFQGVQQLGLRLQPKKAPFDTLVVDHVEKMPTEN